MLPIYHLFIVFIVFEITLNYSVNSFNTFNSCKSESNCKQSSVECESGSHFCICRISNRLSPTSVCLQSANVNTNCMLYQPCLNAKCLLTNGLEVYFNDTNKRKAIRQTLLLNSILRFTNSNKYLGFCRCDKTRPELNCNYKVIGSQCDDHKQCSLAVAYTHCSDGICVCNQTHYHFDDNCLPKKDNQDFCIDSNECQNNLYCKSSQCRCRKNYEYEVSSGICQYFKSPITESNEMTTNSSGNLWNDIEKLGGFVIVVILMLFLCTRKDSDIQNDPLSGSHRRRSSTRAHRQRSSSINSHRPLTQTSSNASRNSSAYRTFEEPVPIRQTIIMPSPAQLIRSLSSSSEEINYNPYQFDTLFPQQSDNDDPPSYEEVVKDMDTHKITSYQITNTSD